TCLLCLSFEPLCLAGIAISFQGPSLVICWSGSPPPPVRIVQIVDSLLPLTACSQLPNPKPSWRYVLPATRNASGLLLVEQVLSLVPAGFFPSLGWTVRACQCTFVAVGP